MASALMYSKVIFGIIGRNGSGKSTLKLIAGVYEPTAGNIYVHGGFNAFYRAKVLIRTVWS